MNNILELNRINADDVRRSSSWFDKQVKQLAKQKISASSLLATERSVSSIKPGKMYFFFYDPKFKDTLPYYDRFPLLLPFDKTGDSFIGLNLHYLDYKPRMILFQELIKISGATHLTETSKLRYSWDMIRGVSKLRAAHPCVKRYLMGHVRSQFIEIKPEFWHTAIMLPVQKFVGASKEKVWKESIRKS